jgi:putative transposase
LQESRQFCWFSCIFRFRISALCDLTCSRFSGPKIAGKFQFSGKCDSGRWTRIEVYGGADCFHPAAQAEEGSAVGEVCRKAGISEAAFVQLAQEVFRLDTVGDEAVALTRGGEGKLKKIVADLSLDKAMLQDVIRRKF